MWPIAEDATKLVFRAPDAKGVSTACFDSKGERIVYADDHNRLAVRDLKSGDEITLRGGPDDINDAQFSPDGARIAVSSESGVSAIWRVDRQHVPSVCSKVISTGRTASNTVATGASSPAETTRRSGSGPLGMAERSS